MKRAWVVALVAGLAGGAVAAEPDDLDRTLARLSRVAELYRDAALGFACQETIVYKGAKTGRIQFAYLFVRDDDGRLRDFRTWTTGTTAARRGQEVNPLDYHVPRFLESAYLWAFVFRQDRQPLHRFTLLGAGEALGRPAWRIKFVPVPPVRAGVNDWAGFAWIDRESSQVLRFETYSVEDWNAKARLDADVESAPRRDPHEDSEVYGIERIVTDFGYQKNGMRFPSHVEIAATRSTVAFGAKDDPRRERVVQTVTQDYTKFEFFSIRTSEEISSFVDGRAKLP